MLATAVTDLRASDQPAFRSVAVSRTDALTMHVVGARFDRAEAAYATLAELRERFGVGADDGGVQRLGSTDYRSRTNRYLLAAPIEDHEVAGALAAIRARGGEIIELRSEDALGTYVVGPPPPEERVEHRLGNGRSTQRPPRPPGPAPPARRSPRAARVRSPRSPRLSR